MPDSSCPKSGWSSPSIVITAALVAPTFLPTIVSPASIRRCTMRDWMPYASAMSIPGTRSRRLGTVRRSTSAEYNSSP